VESSNLSRFSLIFYFSSNLLIFYISRLLRKKRRKKLRRRKLSKISRKQMLPRPSSPRKEVGFYAILHPDLQY